jgi:tetratricopeptide (TPR) repeat protein
MDFAQHHLKLLLGGLAAMVIIVLAVVLVRGASSRSSDQAAGMLADARADISKGAYDAAGARLQEILTTAGGSPSGKTALLLNGDVRFAQGRYEEAQESYRRAVDSFGKDPVMGTAARRGLAASLENLSRNEEAATLYQELAKQATSPEVEGDLLLAVARNYLKLGRHEEAAALYRELAADPATPNAAVEAKMRLAEIKYLQAG